MSNSIFLINMVIWMLFSISCGFAEAVIFHQQLQDIKSKVDKHEALTALRIIVFFGVFKIAIDPIYLFCVIISILVFPFLHDGVYFQTRKWLSDGRVYPKGFFSDISKTSTAKTKIPSRLRTFLFVGSVITIIIILTTK